MITAPKRHLPQVTPIEFNILLSLFLGEQHGLGLIQEIADRTNQEIFLSPGTLYNALKRMFRDGWIEESEEAPPAKDGNAERRRYYRLSEPGYEVLVDEVERMEWVAQETRVRLEPTLREDDRVKSSSIALKTLISKQKKPVSTPR